MAEDLPQPEPLVDDEAKWPGVTRAYDFVLPSYQMLTARFEAADSRLSTVMNLACTLTLGAPILAKSIRPAIVFTSPWFMVAMGFFICALGVGIAGRVRGTLCLPSPQVMYERWLHRSEWTFRKDQIYFAGQHFQHNTRAVSAKSTASLCVAILLAFEIAALVVWIAR